MKTRHGNSLLALCTTLVLGSTGVPAHDGHQANPAPANPATQHADGGFSPLVAKVKRATERYKDFNVAASEGWVRATPCVSGPNNPNGNFADWNTEVSCDKEPADVR